MATEVGDDRALNRGGLTLALCPCRHRERGMGPARGFSLDVAPFRAEDRRGRVGD